MSLHEELLRRYATKAFDSSKKISDADLADLLDALTYSPSSYGLQPWHFVVVTDPAVRTELRPHSWDQSQITDASHLIVLCAKTDMDAAYIEKYVESIMRARSLDASAVEGYKAMMLTNVLSGKTDEERKQWMEKQVYIALGFLMSACMTKGIDSCPMEGFDRAAYDRILGLRSRGFEPVVLCPIGYRSAEDGYAALPKVRFDADELFETV